jgi:predicted glycoside hydrolase/deacetylase ChbG (UPF0249 family)
MKIVNHLDDVGCSAGSVKAWQELRAAGVIRSASVMVPCPYYPMARDDWHDTPDQDMGLHITLTSEWNAYRWRPLIGPVGGLVDSEGFMHHRPSSVCELADPSAVADEMEAQLDRLSRDGLRPTHIDAHMGTAFLPPFGFALIELGKRHGIPVLACRNAKPLWHAVNVAGVDQAYFDEFVREVELAGWPVFDRFIIGFCPDDQEIEDHVIGLLSDLGDGTHYYALHADTAEGYAAFAPHHERARREEFQLFRQESSAQIFKSFQITEYRDLG